MSKVLCTIKDIKAGYYFSPVMCNSVDEFKRIVYECVNSDVSSPVCKYPSDFQLYHVGEFDEHLGLVVGFPDVIYICDAISLKGSSLNNSEEVLTAS